MKDNAAEVAKRTSRDARGYWRKALAIAAPLPMLAQGTYILLNPAKGGTDFAEMVTLYNGQDGRVVAMHWAQLLFFTFLIPAVLAVVAVTRRAVPRLTAIAGSLTVVGFALGFVSGPGDDTLAYLVVKEGLDAETIGKLDSAAWELPWEQLGSLIWIVALVFGTLMLGIALVRSKAAPAWMGIALAVGGFTHPFIPVQLAAGIGLYVAAIGFAGASLALLRMSNDEFDLAPAATGS